MSSHLQVANHPGPRQRPGRRFERLINKAPGFAGGYLLIPAGSFRRRLSEQPELTFKLLGTMSRHMRRLVKQIEQLTARTSAERVAGFLVGLAQGMTAPIRLRLPIDKVLIAGRLGMQPETFSRAIARLRDHGVTVNGSEVAISDLKRLQQLAEGELA